VTRIVLSAAVRDDFERIFDFLFGHAPATAVTRIDAIVQAIDILASSPLIGRPATHGLRELIISTGASGYLALYHYDPLADTVLVLAVRSQRERAYRR
jgi:toxin ParE1/3/4